MNSQRLGELTKQPRYSEGWIRQAAKDAQPQFDFDGQTYERPLDQVRLNAQLRRVWAVIQDRRWRTLTELSGTTGDPEASVSARLRDLRKPRFGNHTIDRRRRGPGLFEYRLGDP